MVTLERIESTLKTQVVDILQRAFSGLSHLDRATIYESVMNSPELLHESFQLLRREPERFATVLTDEQGQRVEAKDEQKMTCGETLGQIKSLVLRASAKRFFRRILGGPSVELVPQNVQTGVSGRMLIRLGLAAPPPLVKQRTLGKGDMLYRAIRDYLRFDWQARLLPDYSRFTPEDVAVMGEQLLEIHEPAELRVLCSEEGRAIFASRARPLFMAEARRLFTKGMDNIDPELLWKLWGQMALSRMFDDADATEGRRIIADVAATSRHALNLLLPVIGKDVRHFATFLFAAYRKLGRIAFRDAFIEGGNTSWMAQVYAERLAELPALPPPSLLEMQEVFDAILDRTSKN